MSAVPMALAAGALLSASFAIAGNFDYNEEIIPRAADLTAQAPQISRAVSIPFVKIWEFVDDLPIPVTPPAFDEIDWQPPVGNPSTTVTVWSEDTEFTPTQAGAILEETEWAAPIPATTKAAQLLWWAEDSNTPSIAEDDVGYAPKGYPAVITSFVFNYNDDVVPSIAEESEWAAPFPPLELKKVGAFTADEEIVPQPATGIAEETEWAPLMATITSGRGLYLPDAEEYPTLYALAEDVYWQPFKPQPPALIVTLWVEDDVICPPPPATITFQEEDWNVYTPAPLVARVVYFQWQDEVPFPLSVQEEDWSVWTPGLLAPRTFSIPDAQEVMPPPPVVDEDYWQYFRPQPAVLLAPLFASSEDIFPRPIPFEEDWNVWTPPLAAKCFIYLPDPEQVPAGSLSAAISESFFRTYFIEAEGRIYYVDAEDRIYELDAEDRIWFIEAQTRGGSV